MEYRKVIANSTETFRFRHLLIEEKIDMFDRIRHLEDEKWFAVDFKSAEIYRSVHWLCRFRLDRIVENGIYWIGGVAGKHVKIQTVIVKIFKSIIVTANIHKLEDYIHVNYRAESRMSIVTDDQRLYNHYSYHRIESREKQNPIKSIQQNQYDRRTSIRCIEGKMFSTRKTKKFYRRLIWRGQL